LVWGTRGNGLDQDPSDDATDDLELWQRCAACFKEAGFQWAGDWPRFKDFPHVQNTWGVDLETLISTYPQGLKPGEFV
jgi:peptidoglycan LD-endopeptidase CwlK